MACAKPEIRRPKPERNPKSECRKAERPKPGFNAETQRSRRDAEKQERANCGMQETPNLSAILCDLRVSALEFVLRISGQDGIGGGQRHRLGLFQQMLHAGVEH